MARRGITSSCNLSATRQTSWLRARPFISIHFSFFIFLKGPDVGDQGISGLARGLTFMMRVAGGLVLQRTYAQVFIWGWWRKLEGHSSLGSAGTSGRPAPLTDWAPLWWTNAAEQMIRSAHNMDPWVRRRRREQQKGGHVQENPVGPVVVQLISVRNRTLAGPPRPHGELEASAQGRR